MCSPAGVVWFTLNQLMHKIFSLRTLAWILAALAVVTLLILAAWVAVAGSVTVSRVLRYGDTDIGDYQHYPSRLLAAGPFPFDFDDRTGEDRVPGQVTLEGEDPVPLDDLLARNDTIAF